MTLAVFCAVAAAAVSSSSCHAAHAQEEGEAVIVRWMIEGQHRQPPSSTEGNGASAEPDNVVVVIERLTGEDPAASAANDTESGFKYDHFVTGNEYGAGDYKISIFSEEGQILNQAIIDQREMQADSFRHKIKYYDRFSDGYVEIAEALLDPIGKQTYYIRGSTHDHPINTNLEVFLLERGYTLDNLQSVPNSVFSPTKFTLGRALLEESGRAGGGAGDLRAYSPNYMEFDRIGTGERMTESVSEQTAHILGQVLFAPIEAEPAPELYTLTTPAPIGAGAHQPALPGVGESAAESRPQSEPFALRGALDAVRQSPQPMFEYSGRVKASIIDGPESMAGEVVGVAPVQIRAPQITHTDSFVHNPAHQYTVLLAVSIAAGLAAFGYMAWRMLHVRAESADAKEHPIEVVMVAVPMSARREDTVRKLLSDARMLYDAGLYKDAHERLGQAIRMFYSHEIGVHGRLTNTELLALMRSASGENASKDYESVKRWLSVCGSVEYAMHSTNAKAFSDALGEFSHASGNPEEMAKGA